ncbi:MAG: ribbon-helix-helix domain-containing protein [Acidithiobacillus sp.]|jgi:hypothetical protein|uniref:Ribbon-helix-helix domain-containing protein n=1 Tax=Acidithiobacillus ferruginosus TaxID=3063951 RepID=A0ACD5IED5_9PROT|nr:ribbon-helix-helix domain-containing protein [Acidithiobacillus ferruginosus]
MAARLERSRGWIMKQALAAWIDQEEERSRLTREALAAPSGLLANLFLVFVICCVRPRKHAQRFCFKNRNILCMGG